MAEERLTVHMLMSSYIIEQRMPVLDIPERERGGGREGGRDKFT